MKTKICSKCAKEQPHSAYFTDRRNGKLVARCKTCVNEAKRANRAKRARCKNCYESIAQEEKEQFAARLCDGCALRKTFETLGVARAEYRLGRPGCIVRDGVAFVLDEEAEAWHEMPVKLCKKCGIDQHLDICLDCTSPVGGQTSHNIRPLYRCKHCGDWRSYKSGCSC